MKNIHVGYVGFRFGPWLLSRETSGTWIMDDGGRIGAVAYEPILRRCLWLYAAMIVRLLVFGHDAVWKDVTEFDVDEGRALADALHPYADWDALCHEETRHPESHVTSLCRLAQGHRGSCEA